MRSSDLGFAVRSRATAPLKALTATAGTPAQLLIAFQLAGSGPLPRSVPDVNDVDDVRALVDREKHAVNMGTATVVEDTYWFIRVEALWGYSVALRELLKG